jgi:hypothetical protein
MVVDEKQQPATGADSSRLGRGRSLRLALSAAIVASMFLGYGVPFYGIVLSLAVPIVIYIGRRELWDATVRRIPLIAVLVWIGLWLPAFSYSLTGWYWLLTGRDLSTAWLLLPLCGPTPIVVGTLVPALAAAVVFAIGLAVSGVLNRPWLVVVGGWLAPWAHELAFTMVVTRMEC